jgi:hypothetical protein
LRSGILISGNDASQVQDSELDDRERANGTESKSDPFSVPPESGFPKAIFPVRNSISRQPAVNNEAQESETIRGKIGCNIKQMEK